MALKQRISQLKAETYALYLAYRDPRVPWYAKVLLAVILAYALSPIDLIPDFIPVIGYLDDLVIIPAGVFLALKLIPGEVIAECRENARTEPMDSRLKWGAAIVIGLLWALGIYVVVTFIWGLLVN
jgi:uncharacterized membrane protein YkvA (DUF1232 family)